MLFLFLLLSSAILLLVSVAFLAAYRTAFTRYLPVSSDCGAKAVPGAAPEALGVRRGAALPRAAQATACHGQLFFNIYLLFVITIIIKTIGFFSTTNAYTDRCCVVLSQEVPVNWQEIDGSKLDLADAIPDMLRDMALVRLCYMIGFWKEEAYAPAGLGDGNE